VKIRKAHRLKLDRFAPSSQTRSGRGRRQPMPLKLRTFGRGSCGAVLDRDLNAARDVERRGVEAFGTVGGGTAEPPSSTATPGDDRSAGAAASAAARHRSTKRELTVAHDAGFHAA
jgi:putative transposase